jgi:hypothetical protein
MTDAKRILALFRQRPNTEICCTELVMGQFFGTKKIIEYTGRLKNARDILGCTCGEDKNSCTASEHIVNTRKGFYKFITQVEVVKPREEQVVVNLQELKQRREALRDEYREAKAKGDQMHMKIVEIRGKAIKNAIEQEERSKLIKESLF